MIDETPVTGLPFPVRQKRISHRKKVETDRKHLLRRGFLTKAS